MAGVAASAGGMNRTWPLPAVFTAWASDAGELHWAPHN
jgi:hypothetical protein